MNEDEIEEAEDGVKGDEPDNSADPVQVKRKEARVAREQRETDLFWASVFATPVGRREMWKILQAGGYGQSAFACGPNGFPQPDATWFAAGKKSLVEGLYEGWQISNYENVFLMHCENDVRFDKAKRKLGIGKA